jgi:regulatory protein
MPRGTITALRAQVNDSQRVNVFIDGDFALGVSMKTLADEGLFVGKIIDDVDWEHLAATEQASKAFQTALRLLEQRPRSTTEIRQRLTRDAVPQEQIDQIVARLGELGLLDDAAFSRLWVENRRAFRPRGTLALQAELRQKGIAPADIAAALADTDANEEIARARTLAQSVVQRYRNAPDRATFMRRCGGFLQRRGFPLSIIRPILDQLWDEREQA